MPIFSPAILTDVATRIFAASGVPHHIAARVAELLVLSERVGHSSHGLLRIPIYLRMIDDGKLIPDSAPVVLRETPTTAVIDGAWGFGQVAAATGVESGIEKARHSGVANVGVVHLNHVGRLGDFTEQGARAGFITFACVGGSPTGSRGNVAPFGGSAAVWGTNPLAIAIPGSDQIFSLDFATSVIAGGKAMAARASGTDLDGEYIIDREGRPTSDPNALFDGGAIRPFGDHKGYALAFAVELLAGAFVGAAAEDLATGEMDNGLLLLLIDPGSFGPVSRFHAAMEGVIERVKSSPPADGFDEVMIPGEPEQRRMSESDRSGISVPGSLIEELNAVAAELGVDPGW